MQLNPFDGKKVLIAGASGLTGHNLFNYVEFLCADVIGTYFDTPVKFSDGRDMFHMVDFTERIPTKRFFERFKFDYVFICCAKTYNAFVCESNPSSMILPNITMVSNILEKCLEHKVGKVVYISSSTVYQPFNGKITEDELDLNQDPHNLYMGVGWMKRYVEKLCEFYRQQGLAIDIVRPTNIYGRYDKTDETVSHVLPALIMRALRNEDPYKVYGTGNPIKNFIHVDDFVRDVTIIAAYGDGNGVYNLCSDEENSIACAVNVILKEVGYSPKVEYLGTEDKIPYKAVSRQKFDKAFGKQTYIKLDKGIKDLIQWFSLLPQTPKI